jgi:hypothetical protein
MVDCVRLRRRECRAHQRPKDGQHDGQSMSPAPGPELPGTNTTGQARGEIVQRKILPADHGRPLTCADRQHRVAVARRPSPASGTSSRPLQPSIGSLTSRHRLPQGRAGQPPSRPAFSPDFVAGGQTPRRTR